MARGIENRWNFPNCRGSIDGKHIRIVKSANSGSFFYNYKEYFSVVTRQGLPSFEFKKRVTYHQLLTRGGEGVYKNKYIFLYHLEKQRNRKIIHKNKIYMMK